MVNQWLNQLSIPRVIFILIGLGLLTYANAIFHPFVHDDVVFIQNNPDINDFNFKDIFLQTTIDSKQHPAVNTYYRPLIELLYRFQYKLFGLNPFGFHFFNVFLHITNSVVLFIFLLKILQLNHWDFMKSKGVAFGIAAIFLTHPVQTEAVACVSGISNLIFAFFCLLSFYFYLISSEIYQRTLKKNSYHGGRERLLYLLCQMTFFIALMAKEQSIVLPVIICLYEWRFQKSQKDNHIKKLLRIGGYFVTTLGYFVMRKMIVGYSTTNLKDFHVELALRLSTIPQALLDYFGLMFWPHNLHYYRSVDMLEPFIIPLMLLIVTVGIVFTIVFFIHGKKKNLLIFGLGWFFVSLLPTLNIIPLVNEYSLLLSAEHFLYFPIIGMLLFIFGLTDHWLVKFKRTFGPIIVCILIFIFIPLSVKQNTYWRGEIPLFERTLQFEENFGRVRVLLAKAYYRDGQYEKAIKEFNKALKIMQGYLVKVNNDKVAGVYIRFIKEIHADLAYTYEVVNRFSQAIDEYEAGSQLDPDNPYWYHRLGLNYIRLKNYDKAINQFQKVLSINKNDLFAINSLAICYREKGNLEKAEELLRYIVDQDPRSKSAKQNLDHLLSIKNYN